MKNNSDFAVVYAFDNFEQNVMFLRSVKSLYKNKNNEYLDLILLVSKNIFSTYSKEITNSIKEIDENIVFKLIEIDTNFNFGKWEGMFFWFFVPFYTNHSKYLILDNDTLINGDLSELIKNQDENFISGVKTSYKWSSANKKTINYFEKNDKKSKIKTYINTGVVLIDGNFFRKSNKNYLEEKIINFVEKSKENNLKFADQEFLYIYFGEFVSKIDFKWNIRIQNFLATNKSIKKKNFIFHYNMFFSPKNKSYVQKIDLNIIFNENYNEKLEYLLKTYKLMSGSFLNIQKKKYISNIINLIENITSN